MSNQNLISLLETQLKLKPIYMILINSGFVSELPRPTQSLEVMVSWEECIVSY